MTPNLFFMLIVCLSITHPLSYISTTVIEESKPPEITTEPPIIVKRTPEGNTVPFKEKTETVRYRGLTAQILTAIKNNKSLTIKEDIYTINEAIDEFEKVYCPYTYGGTGLRGLETKDGVFITFHSHAKVLLEQNEYIGKRIREVSSQIFYQGIKEGEAVKRINDWIINAVDYERDTRDLYSLFKKHKGNCDSYSNVFRRFCDYIGIECENIIGVSGEDHEWNRVKIGNKWYYIDVTFNQSTDNKYFLSEKLWDTHTIKGTF